MFRIACNDCCGSITDSSSDPAAATTPVHVRELNLRDAKRRRKTNRIIAVVAIRGKAIDIFNPQSRIPTM